MKNFLPKPAGKQIVVGLLLIASAAILGILLADKFSGPDSSMIHRLIFVVCVIGLGLGGFAYIFIGWRGLVMSLGFVLVIALPKALPDPWNRYFSFLYIAALVGVPPLIAWHRNKKKSPNESARKKPNNLRTMLKRLRVGLLIAIGAIALPWLFLNVPYKLFSALSLLPFPVVLTTICMFPDEVSLDDTAKKRGGRIEFAMPLICSVFAPVLRAMMDFNFLSWTPLLIQAGVMLILIGVVLLVFYKELRQRIGYFLCVLLVCSIFCVGCIGQLNYLLDFSAPRQQTAVITDMHISSGSKSPDRYILTVVTQSGVEMDLMTSEEHYDSLSQGESVTVYIKDGGLGIPYAMAD